MVVVIHIRCKTCGWFSVNRRNQTGHFHVSDLPETSEDWKARLFGRPVTLKPKVRSDGIQVFIGNIDASDACRGRQNRHDRIWKNGKQIGRFFRRLTC